MSKKNEDTLKYEHDHKNGRHNKDEIDPKKEDYHVNEEVPFT